MTATFISMGTVFMKMLESMLKMVDLCIFQNGRNNICKSLYLFYIRLICQKQAKSSLTFKINPLKQYV